MFKSVVYAKTVLLLSLAVITSACSAVSSQVAEKVTLHDSSIEAIYGFEIKTDSLWFLVKSNGCTNENNFSLQLNNLGGNKIEITLHRKKRDLCRGLTKLISINMPMSDNKSAENHFIVSNQFSLKPSRIKR